MSCPVDGSLLGTDESNKLLTPPLTFPPQFTYQTLLPRGHEFAGQKLNPTYIEIANGIDIATLRGA